MNYDALKSFDCSDWFHQNVSMARKALTQLKETHKGLVPIRNELLNISHDEVSDRVISDALHQMNHLQDTLFLLELIVSVMEKFSQAIDKMITVDGKVVPSDHQEISDFDSFVKQLSPSETSWHNRLLEPINNLILLLKSLPTANKVNFSTEQIKLINKLCDGITSFHPLHSFKSLLQDFHKSFNELKEKSGSLFQKASQQMQSEIGQWLKSINRIFSIFEQTVKVSIPWDGILSSKNLSKFFDREKPPSESSTVPSDVETKAENEIDKAYGICFPGFTGDIEILKLEVLSTEGNVDELIKLFEKYISLS